MQEKDDKSILRWISRGTMGACLVVFAYIGIVYNLVFLGRILPAAGRDAFVPPLAVVFNSLLGLALWSYARAHCADPGRVPDRWHVFVQNVAPLITIAPARPEWQPGKATKCKKCDGVRPERSHHCTICQQCVLRMDHHCPWIANCVGFKNHKYFLLLAIYGCLGSAFGFLTILPELLEAALLPLQEIVGASENQASPTATTTMVAMIATSSVASVQTTVTTTALVNAVSTTAASGSTAPALPWFEASPSTGSPAAPTPFVPLATYAVESPDKFSGFATTTLVTTTSSSTSPNITSGGTSVERDELVRDAGLLVGLAVMTGMVAFMLAMLLYSHFPLACTNMTTIEENYDNMPNPFEHGSYMKNLAQVFGSFGPDWFFPIAPRKPLSDGISYPRPADPVLSSELGFQPEDIWRLRYVALAAQQRADLDQAQNDGLFTRFFATFS